MFKIYAMICFLTIGPTDGTLCFNSEVPIKYKDLKNCSLDKKRLIDYLHEDLVDREVTIIFKCSSEGSNV